ncbi:hypothetical protein EKK58_11065 [Candidatus Dependentiae bacterium]|nr:MAG: hypothetical protein EKK58_11065 [Candidatus Dependentiae bacterium]
MKAKEIVWSELVASPDDWHYDGYVGNKLVYRIYDNSIHACEYYFISSMLPRNPYDLMEQEFHSLNDAKAKCEEDLRRYVDWLQNQLQWLGGN